MKDRDEGARAQAEGAVPEPQVEAAESGGIQLEDSGSSNGRRVIEACHMMAGSQHSGSPGLFPRHRTERGIEHSVNQNRLPNQSVKDQYGFHTVSRRRQLLERR